MHDCKCQSIIQKLLIRNNGRHQNTVDLQLPAFPMVGHGYDHQARCPMSRIVIQIIFLGTYSIDVFSFRITSSELWISSIISLLTYFDKNNWALSSCSTLPLIYQHDTISQTNKIYLTVELLEENIFFKYPRYEWL